jgi:pimeloyl-ACP methyl ester carboxylesterase
MKTASRYTTPPMPRCNYLRIARWAGLACILGCGRLAAAAAPAPPTMPLEDCRLEHPFALSSVSARCGHLAVSEDPSHPEGARLDLHVAVISALNRRSLAAPLFLLAGGPGQSASDLYASYAGAFARINRNHDIVLVDQRGTGRSSPLDCTYPDDWRDGEEAMTALRTATLGCLNRYGTRVRFFTTSLAVADLDQVRRALGYARIDLYGSSYGTRVAELYMRRFPAATHAVILDGVTYPEQVIGPETPEDAERALRLILARCHDAPACAAAYPLLEHDFEQLRLRFGPDKAALTLSDPLSGEPLAIEFNHGVFSAALRFMSYSAGQASLLPTLIHRAAAGDLAPLAAQAVMMARQAGTQLAAGMQNSVICSEDVPFFAVSAADRTKIDATYLGVEQLEGVEAICKLWPKGPVDADLHSPLESAIPTLLLSGEADPVTPPADAARAARGLSRQRQLVLAGEGHGQLAVGCMPKLMAEFLDGTDPHALDARCLERHRPAPFFTSLTGPAP